MKTTRYRRIHAWVALLSLFVLGACGDEDRPTSPALPIKTEVTVGNDAVAYGDVVHGVVHLTVTSAEQEVIQFDHGSVVGFRVRSASGELMLWAPRSQLGTPVEVIVRPDEETQLAFGFPTIKPAVQTAYDVVEWSNGVEALAPGSYTISAGLYGLEGTYYWGRATFSVVSAEVGGR